MKKLLVLVVASMLAGCAVEPQAPVDIPTGEYLSDGITFVGCTDTTDGSFHAGSFQAGGHQLMINNGKPIDGVEQNQYGLYTQGSLTIGYYSLIKQSKVRGKLPSSMKLEMLLNGALNITLSNGDGVVSSYKCEIIQ